MIIDSYEMPNGKVVNTDLCIIGGGMAGIAMARELKRTGLGVVVLESGGTGFEGPSQSLYQGTGELSGEGTSTRNLDTYLMSSRFRQLGGSGNKWGGKCGIPDEEVFERRSWVPNSGWPFSREHLMPFYDRACDVLKVNRFDYVPTESPDTTLPVLSFDNDKRITTSTRHMSPVSGRAPQKDAFEAYLKGVTDEPAIDLYLHANVVEFMMNEAGNAVNSVKVATLEQKTFTVEAKQFVLATGGIENARMLLLANQRQPQGLGNQHDLVGRYFSGHMTFGSGSQVFFSNLSQPLPLYIGRNLDNVWGVLKTTKELQAQHQLPNATMTLSSNRPRAGDMGEAILKSAYLSDGRMNSLDVSEFNVRKNLLTAYFMSEQSSNVESRITLSNVRDSLGHRRVQLDWKFTPGDLDAVMKSANLFAQEMGAAGMGRMKPFIRRDSILAKAGMSSHHIGSTRMDDDPKRGVVDTNCKVHGVANLHIAGSSVFPSPGIINPTLTIIALGLKLCDNLRTKL